VSRLAQEELPSPPGRSAPPRFPPPGASSALPPPDPLRPRRPALRLDRRPLPRHASSHGRKSLPRRARRALLPHERRRRRRPRRIPSHPSPRPPWLRGPGRARLPSHPPPSLRAPPPRHRSALRRLLTQAPAPSLEPPSRQHPSRRPNHPSEASRFSSTRAPADAPPVNASPRPPRLAGGTTPHVRSSTAGARRWTPSRPSPLATRPP